jgi:hypothetical protein
MITVLVWNRSGGGSCGRFWGDPDAGVGHAAMEIGGGEPAGAIYVSWWPRGDTFGDVLVGTPAFRSRTLAQEIRDEGGAPPDHRIRIPGCGENPADNGLDESAIKAWWAEWRRDPTYRLADRSCCTAVVRGLLAGGAEEYASGTLSINPSAIVWGPSDVVAIANACVEGIGAMRY